jgi:site-specific DNA-cytosine methylase
MALKKRGSSSSGCVKQMRDCGNSSSNGGSKHPDLAGYFLAVVGGLRPKWVVRENVPAPTVDHFDAALVALGYGTVVIRVDAAEITGQSRQRDIIVGRYQASRPSLRELFSDCEDGPGPYTTRLGKGEVVPALTTHRTRYDSRDCYIWEPGRGLRILDGDEREALAGLPAGWTSEFSEAARARICGNSAVPEWFRWIGERIRQAEMSR